MDGWSNTHDPATDLPTLGEALWEPTMLAFSWMQSPPWALLAALFLTLFLLAWLGRRPPWRPAPDPDPS